MSDAKPLTLRETLDLADAALTNHQLAFAEDSNYLVCNCCGVTATVPCKPDCEITNAKTAVRAMIERLKEVPPTQAHREAAERILRTVGDDLTHRGAADTVAGACAIENAELREDKANMDWLEMGHSLYAWNPGFSVSGTNKLFENRKATAREAIADARKEAK